jgi:hypothetical protein
MPAAVPYDNVAKTASIAAQARLQSVQAQPDGQVIGGNRDISWP